MAGNRVPSNPADDNPAVEEQTRKVATSFIGDQKLSLAADQGDADALVKRNEIGTRLAPGEKTAIDAEMARG